MRAARQLKVTWDSSPTLSGSDGMYEAMRAAKTDDRIVVERGNAADAIGAAPHKVSYNCRAPYQAHAPFGPNCALADVKADSALVMCSTQDVYGTRGALARILEMPVDKVRVQYYEGSGTYGHSCYDDVAQAASAALAIGREAGTASVHALGRTWLGQLRTLARGRSSRRRQRRRKNRRVRVSRLATSLEQRGNIRAAGARESPPLNGSPIPRCK